MNMTAAYTSNSYSSNLLTMNQDLYSKLKAYGSKAPRPFFAL